MNTIVTSIHGAHIKIASQNTCQTFRTGSENKRSYILYTMIMTIIITIINELLLSDKLTVLCDRKTMYDLKNVTLSKLLNPFEPQFPLL